MKIFGFAGFSGSGKTTLIEKLIPLFKTEGYSISLVKHAHHDFEIDRPGKDSYRHRLAGAKEVLVTSSRRWALMHELSEEQEPSLSSHVERLAPCDIVFVEGFKREPIPKIEIHRSGLMKPLLFPFDRHIVAIACDTEIDASLPRFELDRTDLLAQFIKRYLGLSS